jgi:hypothetical protein
LRRQRQNQLPFAVLMLRYVLLFRHHTNAKRHRRIMLAVGS